MVGATALATGIMTVTPGSASVNSLALWAGFETGTTTAWSETENVEVGLPYAKNGLFGARAVADSTQAGYLKWSSSLVDQGHRYGRVRAWVRVVSFEPGESVDVFTLKNSAGSHHFDFYRDARTGKWRYDLFRDDDALSTMTADVGQWYYVEALVDFGGPDGDAYSAEVRIDGVSQPGIASSTTETGTTVRAALFGGSEVGRTNTRDYDSLAVDVGDDPFTFTR